MKLIAIIFAIMAIAAALTAGSCCGKPVLCDEDCPNNWKWTYFIIKQKIWNLEIFLMKLSSTT